MVTHKGTVTLETPRLLLRRASTEDALPMFRNWASDSRVTEFLTWPTYKTPETAIPVLTDWADSYKKDDFYQWMIVLKELGEPIGTISVVGQNPKVASAEIGYCIGSRWWHRGIMTEALGAVMDFLFDQVGMERIEARHDVENPHSGGVMIKCGMKYEGTSRRSGHSNRGICDLARYAILRSDREKPEHFLSDFSPKDDTELVQAFYRTSHEDSRLQSQAGRVEFLTTVRCVEECLFPGAKILDIGAGTGAYSFYFAEKGYHVSALELADGNIAVFRSKLTGQESIDLVQGNALDLSRYADESFDAVLLFGPLYHLHSREDQLRCIREAKRVCKKSGKIFFAFISNDIVILTMQQMQSDYLLQGDYDKETFRLDDFPFVFHTVDRCRELLQQGGIKICREVAADGVSELLQDLINGLDPASYRQYLRFHYYLSEKPECLGLSNHLLFVGEKQ